MHSIIMLSVGGPSAGTSKKNYWWCWWDMDDIYIHLVIVQFKLFTLCCGSIGTVDIIYTQNNNEMTSIYVPTMFT